MIELFQALRERKYSPFSMSVRTERHPANSVTVAESDLGTGKLILRIPHKEGHVTLTGQLRGNERLMRGLFEALRKMKALDVNQTETGTSAVFEHGGELTFALQRPEEGAGKDFVLNLSYEHGRGFLPKLAEAFDRSPEAREFLPSEALHKLREAAERERTQR